MPGKPSVHIGMGQASVRTRLGRMLEAALNAVDPAGAVRRAVHRTGTTLHIGKSRYNLRRYARVVAVGAGKAGAHMGKALEDRLGGKLDSGMVVVKYGHAVPTRVLKVLEAGHPVPDQAGQEAAVQLLNFVGGLDTKDLLFVLLSGGASSLLPAPAKGLTLQDKQQTTQLLLRSGATIGEMNTVRKHLSTLKGGGLAAATQARVVSLILSDVIGDDLATIGSGPTAPDPTTFADAYEILQRHRIWDLIPQRVRERLSQGMEGTVPETPKPEASLFRRVQNHIIGNNSAAVEAAAQAARKAGYRPLILSTSLTGEAKDVAKVYGALAREISRTGRPIKRPACLIAGGECTVTIRGDGKGGRAQEFALAAAHEIAGLPNVWVAGFGTDGTDGPTDSAGAVVDGQTVARAERAGLDPKGALLRNDAYPLFTTLDAHIMTGPTGTNVNDLYLLLAF